MTIALLLLFYLVGGRWGSRDPLASMDLAILGWAHETFLRTVGVGSFGLASLTLLSGGGGFGM